MKKRITRAATAEKKTFSTQEVLYEKVFEYKSNNEDYTQLEQQLDYGFA